MSRSRNKGRPAVRFRPNEPYLPCRIEHLTVPFIHSRPHRIRSPRLNNLVHDRTSRTPHHMTRAVGFLGFATRLFPRGSDVASSADARRQPPRFFIHLLHRPSKINSESPPNVVLVSPMSCLCSAQAAQMHYEGTCSSYSFRSSAHEDLLPANDTDAAFVGPGDTAATELFCRGGKIESRLLKFCLSHAIPLSGMAICNSAKFKQSAITFCLLIKVVRPRQ